MPYAKAIIYGKFLELYTYEKNVRINGGRRGKVQSDSLWSDIPVSSGVEVEKAIQKRQGHKKRAVSSFRRLVLANNGFTHSSALVTLTYSSNQKDLGIGYKDFHTFIVAMRRKYGQVFRYIAVPEFQKRGALHFHTLFWGLPENICREERRTRMVASLWGRGFVDCFETDGSSKLAGYLAKYMSKSYEDLRLAGKKAYRCSRNVFRPLVERDVGASLLYLNHQYGIGVDNPPCKDVEFDTQWLGKGRYRLYNLN